MRSHWEEKDIHVGMYIIRESAPAPIEEHNNRSFASSVTYQIGWLTATFDPERRHHSNHYVMVAITDGMILLSSREFNAEQLAEFLNEDHSGYRICTLEELNYMNGRLKGRIEGKE